MRILLKERFQERKEENKKRIFLALILLSVFNFAYSQTGTLIEISGKVTDQESNLPLPDVSVQIKGTVTGTVTNSTGGFILRTKTQLPFTLVFSSIGFKEQELQVTTLGSS